MSTTHPLPTMPELDIRVAADAYEAAEAQHLGYEPVECSFGSVSIVGDLELDHHGSMADRPPVCAQTRWVLHHPAPTHYVVAGPPDADASLCIAILSSPALRETVACGERYLRAIRAAEEEDRVTATCPWVMATEAAYGDRERLIDAVIGLVGSADCGRWEDLTREGHAGMVVLAWHARQRSRARGKRAIERAWVLAVRDWGQLLALPGDDYELARAIDAETERIRLAWRARRPSPRTRQLTGESPSRAPARPARLSNRRDGLASSSRPSWALTCGTPTILGCAAMSTWQIGTCHGLAILRSETARISVSIRPGHGGPETETTRDRRPDRRWMGRPAGDHRITTRASR